MLKQTQLILIINIVGGVLVLGGYAWGLITHPYTRDSIWGGIPESWKPYYTISMFFAAAGYLTLLYYLTFAEGQTIKPLDGKYGMEFFIFLYTIYLILAALWMPSTFKVLESGNSNWWFLVQFSLWGVALSTLLMTVGLFMADNISNPSLHKWATLGSVYVTFHCLVLDAWLWTGKFPQ